MKKKVIAEFHYLDDGSEGPPRRWDAYALVPVTALDVVSCASVDGGPWIIQWGKVKMTKSKL